MSTILVKTAGRPFRCEVGDPGLCRYCGGQIVWGTTPRGRKIPLECFDAAALFAEAHFKYCAGQLGGEASSRSDLRRPPRGVEMSLHIWRLFLQLTHPDRHAGNEARATEAARWLIEQRSRLVQEKDK